VSMISRTSLCRFTVKASDSVQTTNGTGSIDGFFFGLVGVQNIATKRSAS
jgi:hypothetical protein